MICLQFILAQGQQKTVVANKDANQKTKQILTVMGKLQILGDRWCVIVPACKRMAIYRQTNLLTFWGQL